MGAHAFLRVPVL